MAGDLFREVSSPHVDRSGRRYTVSASIAAHAIVVAVLVIAPLIASDVLPSPRIALGYTQIVLPKEPPPPAPRALPTSAPQVVSPNAAPVVAPTAISPETGLENVSTPSGDDGVITGVTNGVGSLPVAPEPIAAPPPLPAKPVPVGGRIRPPLKIHDVRPLYPAIAMSARLQGVVILEAVIGPQGDVESLRILRSIPLLDEAAVTAVRQWRYTPTLLNGEPVAVIMTVTVNFALQ